MNISVMSWNNIGISVIVILIVVGFIVVLNLVHARNQRRKTEYAEASKAFYGGSASYSIVMQGIGHELSSPITGIGGILKRLEIRISENRATMKEVIDKITICRRECSRMESLLRDLQGLSRLQKQAGFEIIRLDELIEKVVATFRHAYPNITVVTNCPKLDCIRVIPYQIVTVLTHILKNSAEAIGKKEKGTITINLYACPHNEGKDKDLCISVTDNGGGIKHMKEWKVFQPFQTAGKRGGTGLGLFFCKEIIENNHGGNITARSDERRGETSITITLPIN